MEQNIKTKEQPAVNLKKLLIGGVILAVFLVAFVLFFKTSNTYIGAVATVSTTANLFSPLFVAIRDAYQRGDMAKAKEYQQALNLRVEALCSVGIFAGTKYACTVKGIDCGKCRRPFDELDVAGMQLVRDLIAMPYPEGV